MGAIVSDFPNLPQDADPNRVVLYTLVYSDLTAMGLSLPAQPANSITRAQLLAHLQTLAGVIVRTELDNDPEGLGYSGASDVVAAGLINADFAEIKPKLFPGASALGYATVVATTASSLIAAGGASLDTLLGTGTNTKNGLYARFRTTASTVANRGIFRAIDSVISAVNITVVTPFPGTPTIGDVFDLVFPRFNKVAAMINQILRRFPFSPNIMSTADITGARI